METKVKEPDQLSLRYLKGVGPRRAAVFNGLGVHTTRDILSYYPFRYEDRRNFKQIAQLQGPEPVLVKGEVKRVRLNKIPRSRSRKVRSILEVLLADSSAACRCVWFNQPYLADSIKPGQELIIYGKPSFDAKGRASFNSPLQEQASQDDSLNLGRIVGVYRLPPSFSQRFIRKVVAASLDLLKGKLDDPLPFKIRDEQNMPNIARSLYQIHFPESLEAAQGVRQRFIFEELFFSQIMVYLRKAQRRRLEAPQLAFDSRFLERIKADLGFSLTAAQEEAAGSIIADLAKPYPMHRLLQGDVGCGKTVVAAFGLGLCAHQGYQAALMVPTEVLAYQHQATLKEIFSGFGFRIELLTSSLARPAARALRTDLAQGKVDIIVGTHALIQQEVAFKNLGLVVIDEQHRFGVAQRSLLPKKGVPSPHCLVMSATPIPRSLALSLYGDLDLSVIKELPPGRLQPESLWLPEKKRAKMYEFLRTKLSEGRQAYIVYPVIEETAQEDLAALEVMYQRLTKEFAGFRLAMFHGRMPARDKLRVVEEFKAKKIDLLLTTTVVEVGVNIENATVMMVENPERFGLAQLHQLRGRIRRSTHQPHFILISRPKLSDKAQKRLEVISGLNDGFKIAEEDLLLRGPGDFFGNIQHGLPLLKIANPLKDLEVLKQARAWAYKIIKEDSLLERSEHRSIRDHLGLGLKS